MVLRCISCDRKWTLIIEQGERILKRENGGLRLYNYRTGKQRKVICPKCFEEERVTEYTQY